MSLVDYGSSSDEDEIHANSNVTLAQVKSATKRALPVTSEPTSTSGKKAKAAPPPLPSTITDLFKDRERPEEDPQKYGGKVRQRPHIQGSWPVHVYLEVKLSEDLFDMASSIVQHIRESKVVRESATTVESLFPSIESMKIPNSARKDAEDANDATELHISLTRPLYLQQVQLGRFASELKETFEARKRFSISFSGLQYFSNDDCSRSFVSFRVGAGHAELESLVAEMDVIAEKYGQPKFYDPPEFHASFASAVGGDVLTSETIGEIPELEREMGHDLRHATITIRSVAWKLGPNRGSVALT